jgi:hypothetical protein
MMEGLSLRNVGSYKNHTASRPNEGILQSHHRENLKYFIALTGWALAETEYVSCKVRTGNLYPRGRHSS